MADDQASLANDIGSKSPPPFKPLPQKAPDVAIEKTDDGTYYVRSNHPPAEGPRSIAHLLAERAAQHPERPYILQREPGYGPWRGVTHGEAHVRVAHLAGVVDVHVSRLGVLAEG